MLGFSLVDTTRESSGLKLEDYWRRAIYGAAAAKRIAALVKCGDPEEVFIAALMQDIGMPAINAAWAPAMPHFWNRPATPTKNWPPPK